MTEQDHGERAQRGLHALGGSSSGSTDAARDPRAAATDGADAQSPSGKPLALSPWWGRYDVLPGAPLHFRIGPRELWLERLPRELRLTRRQHADPLDATLRIGGADASPTGEGLSAERFALSSGHGVVLEPRLADRPVVVRTHEPFHVLADDAATLYLTTPCWIALSTAAPSRLLTELPCYRPSDTWFGPSTREGELCYAGVTTARLDLEELAMRPGRIVTQLRIVNQAATRLDLDRIALPTPGLSIYAAADHRLWTQPVRITRQPDGAIGSPAIESALSPEAGDAVLVSGPRQEGEHNPFARAFRALLS